MWVSGGFFSLSFPLFFPGFVSYLLLAYVAEGLDIFVHTSFSHPLYTYC